jgi:hypothetical protein
MYFLAVITAERDPRPESNSTDNENKNKKPIFWHENENKVDENNVILTYSSRRHNILRSQQEFLMIA